MGAAYDASGQPLTMTQDGTLYYYVLNVQGDVTGLIDGDGNLLICYLYEGFGEGYYTANTSNQTAALASTNPLGYRGYVLDIGTAIYYLQSRYYDPTLGRFLNADALASTGQGLLGDNMFTYCLNNPANGSDPCGTCYHSVVFWIDCEQCQEAKQQQEFINYVERSTQKFSIWELDLMPFGKIGISYSHTFQEKDEGQLYFYSDVECIGSGLSCVRTSEIGTGINADLADISVGLDTDFNAFVDTQTPISHTRISAGINGIGVEVGVVFGNGTIDLEIEGGLGTWLLAMLMSPAPQPEDGRRIIVPVPIPIF